MEILIGLLFGIPLLIFIIKLSYGEGGTKYMGTTSYVSKGMISAFWIYWIGGILAIYLLGYLLYR